MAQNQALPSPAYPMVDSSGKISPIWFQFFNSLYQRTGGGSSEGSVQSVAVNATNGIIASVDNPTTAAVVNLSLGGISPASITTKGAIIGTSGYFSTGLATAGTMQFGAYVNTPITDTGYVTINDATGVARRLMVG